MAKKRSLFTSVWNYFAKSDPNRQVRADLKKGMRTLRRSANRFELDQFTRLTAMSLLQERNEILDLVIAEMEKRQVGSEGWRALSEVNYILVERIVHGDSAGLRG